MSVAILDARQWQQVVDLQTGRKVDADGPVVNMVKGVLSRHPFPGDCDPAGNAWAVDTALDFIEHYDPSFVFLTLARQYYSARFNPLTAEERKEMVTAAFAEADRFAKQSGFFTVLVGTGDMTPVKTPIDLSGLDGMAVCCNWATRYSGLYDLTESDREKLAAIPELERLASRQEMIELFGGSPRDGARLPEYMAVAREGHYFKNASLRRLHMIPARNTAVPVSANLENVDSLTGVKGRLLDLLSDRKVALVYLEGVGCSDFQVPFTPCRNGEDWYCYEPGDGHYFALTTGRHSVFEHNGGYRYFMDDNENKKYPFSGYFSEFPEGTIGQEYSGKSIAVGNRSMFMHVATGCDVSCECFARNLYNQGTMGVVRRQDKN